MKRLRNYFISGLLFWIPLALSVLVIKFFLEVVNNFIPTRFLPETLLNLDTSIPGSGILLVIVIILLTGALVTNILGRKLLALWERALNKIPGFRNIYNVLKKVSTTVLNTSSDSLFADSDNDGLFDSVETDTGVFVSEDDTGTDPNNPDTDEDGWKDGAEVKLNTSPFDDRSRPKFQVQGGINNSNQFRLLFPVVTGNSYSIEGSGNLRDWQVLEFGIEGDGEAVERTYLTSEAFRFYRVKRQ